MAETSDDVDIRVDWHVAGALPSMKRVPSVFSPTSGLESLAEGLNRLSQRSGLVDRTNCDFCNQPFPRFGHVPALLGLTIVSTVGGTKGDTKTVTGPPWYLCDSCKAALGLNEGVSSVPLAKVRRYYEEQVIPRLREALVQQLGASVVSRVRIAADLYGPG